MVNGVWVDMCFLVKPSYQELLKGIYNCEAKNIDFLRKAGEVIHEANSWAKSTSRGRITKFLEPGSVSSVTAVILPNALHFKGPWIHEFYAESTKNRDFYLFNGDSVSVPFMTSGRLSLYRSFSGFKVLRIPCRRGEFNRQFSIYFFLPDERDGLQNLLHKFNSDPGFLQQKNYFDPRKVNLEEFWIPKFKFSFGFDVADHPFMFMIKEEESKLVCFTGAVLNPIRV